MFDEKYIKQHIRDIPDYPKKGVLFRDITTLLNDRKAFTMCINELAKRLADKEVDYVVGIEARGFIFGSALAYKLGVGFVPIRKKGKLPHRTLRRDYEKEYGKDSMEIHRDAFEKDSNVVVADDLLATGDTARAATELVGDLGGRISALAFLIELKDLKGRSKLKNYDIVSLVKY